ncbi:alpha/beta hydrolase [Caenimonas aquaedulcis]|uniref:Alpha/beta fold hydrolase n=1 Tax=Caenimonas aquaedulcis TaxID=2793270 RepID=A0A931MJ59_9BURK|nr:alpha/beta fold hydrolase [Caenimonas aquaedulcis]MBG9390438.1 alpha/beta fold hydrolase [Caenimonas aquaedulcis]
MHRDVTFKARDGTSLSGWFFPVERAGGTVPCVVLTHGFSAQIDFGLEPFARILQGAGIAALLYDHRGWGRSGSEPRLQSDPFQQVHDMRDAVTYLATLPEVDEHRIGIWGNSYSGGVALMVAAVDRRVKSVVAVAPLISGSAGMRRMMGEQNHATHLAEMARVRKAEMLSGTVAYRQHTAHEETIAWFREADHEGQWQNRVATLSYDMMGEFEPGDYVPRIAPTPLLMVVPEDDTRSPADMQLDAFERAKQPKQLIRMKGGHYEPYRQVDAVGGAARDWFLKTLAR